MRLRNEDHREKWRNDKKIRERKRESNRHRKYRVRTSPYSIIKKLRGSIGPKNWGVRIFLFFFFELIHQPH